MLARLVAARDLGVRTHVWADRSGWLAKTADGRLLALDWELEDRATFHLPQDALGEHGVSPDSTRAVVSAQNRVVVVDATGREVWNFAHPSWGRGDSERGSCAFSADGLHVWAHVSTETGPDEWVVLDSRTGEVEARAQLECMSAGSNALFHPDGVHLGLSVGEGQDGSESYWGRLDGGTLIVHRLQDRTRILIDVAPNGETFMTTPHGLGPVQVHPFPDGQVIASVEPDGPLEDDDILDMFGGFLADKTIVFTYVERDQLFVASVDTPDEWEKVSVPSPRAGQVLLVANGLCLSTDWLKGHYELWRVA